MNSDMYSRVGVGEIQCTMGYGSDTSIGCGGSRFH